MRIFDKRAANTIPYPAKEAEKHHQLHRIRTIKENTIPMQNMYDLKEKVDLNLGILSAYETAILMNSPEKAEERTPAAKEIIDTLEEANKERTKQIDELIDTLQETVEAMPEDANQQGVMDAIETLKGFLGWAL